MTPVLVPLAALVALGAAIAVSARIPRAAILGLVVVLAGTPFVADPAPGVTATTARVVAAILAGYVLWIAVRGPLVATGGSRVGMPAAVTVGLAAFAAGWFAADAVGLALGAGDGDGPSQGTVAGALAAGSPVARAAVAAASALLVLAAAPVLLARDALRLAIGVQLLLSAAGLAGAALGEPGDAATVAMAVLTAGTGVVGAAVVRRSRTRSGELELHDPPPRDLAVRPRPRDEAHPARSTR